MKLIKPVENIVSDNSAYLKIKFDLKININKILNIYCNRKLHKNPTKARFTIATPKCSDS